MSYGDYWGMGNCAHIPSLPNYAKAKEHYASVTPIRGRDNVRPLGAKRRYTWFRIKENRRVVEDGFLGQYITTYTCTLYDSHDCVEYFPDGSIVIRTFGWHTPTTLGFINYATRDFGHIESVKGKWYWKQKHDGKMFLINTQQMDRKSVGIKLRREGFDDEGYMVVDKPIKEHKYAINRKAMNVVRKKYEFFRDYCYVMLSMNNAILREEAENIAKELGFIHTTLLGTEHWRTEDRNKINRELFFSRMDRVIQAADLELMYSLAIFVSYSFGHWSYRDNTSICKPESFNKQWSELLKYQFFKDVTVAKDVEVGVSFKDANTKYL